MSMVCPKCLHGVSYSVGEKIGCSKCSDHFRDCPPIEGLCIASHRSYWFHAFHVTESGQLNWTICLVGNNDAKHGPSVWVRWPKHEAVERPSTVRRTEVYVLAGELLGKAIVKVGGYTAVMNPGFHPELGLVSVAGPHLNERLLPGKYHALLWDARLPNDPLPFAMAATGYRRLKVPSPEWQGEGGYLPADTYMTVNGFSMVAPKWSRMGVKIRDWQIEAVPNVLPILTYSPDPELVERDINQDSAAGRFYDNRWCRCPPHACEVTDARPFYAELKRYLELHGFGRLEVPWVQRKWLRYVSDGKLSQQAGVLIRGGVKQQDYDGSPILYEGMAWGFQLFVEQGKSHHDVVGGRLFVDDDFRYLGSDECLRIDQTQSEYKKGINLYAPSVAPLTLVEFLRGPITDKWDRMNRLSVLRPVEVYKPKPRRTAAQLQGQLLRKLQGLPEETRKLYCPHCIEVYEEYQLLKFIRVIKALSLTMHPMEVWECHSCEYTFAYDPENNEFDESWRDEVNDDE